MSGVGIPWVSHGLVTAQLTMVDNVDNFFPLSTYVYFLVWVTVLPAVPHDPPKSLYAKRIIVCAFIDLVRVG